MVQIRSQPVLLAVADISGYTRFMVAHGKATEHSHLIISELLEAIMSRIEDPLVVQEIEGDAVFMYALRQGDAWREARAGGRVFASLIGALQAFADKRAELEAYSVCRCEACGAIAQLKLKMIVHSGEALFTRTGRFNVLSGIDVILVHRLMKNSIEADEYVLLTDAAVDDLELPDDFQLVRGEEQYDVGTTPTNVHFLSVRSRFDPEAARASFTDENVAVQILRREIQREYARVAREPDGGYHFNTGRAAAALLGYDEGWLEAIPEDVVASFCGMGNPFAMGVLESGERVVDVGSGAGLDALIAARMVGDAGRVVGVDMTDAMLKKSRAAAARAGFGNVVFREGYSESLPVENGWADVIISNGVLNLSPDKRRVLREFHRVLRPGGRLQIGDILVDDPIPDAARRDVDLWTS